MRAYKFLTAGGLGVFSRFAWPLPDGGPGAWVESEVDPCRAGIHACRPADLPYWVAPALYEIELDGPVEERALKIVAPRGRLLRRVDGLERGSAGRRTGRCACRARTSSPRQRPELLAGWAPPAGDRSPASRARLGFIAARIAEELGGRRRSHRRAARARATWLVEQLALA